MYLLMRISGEKCDLKGAGVHKFHLLKLHGSVTQLVKKSFSFFLEPEGSLLCSQNPTNRTGSEPDESSVHPHTLLL